MKAKLLLIGLVVFTVALAGCADEEEPAEGEEVAESNYDADSNVVTQAPAPTTQDTAYTDSGNPIA